MLAGLLVLSLLAGTVAAVSVIRAGHSVAESVWDDGADGAAPRPRPAPPPPRPAVGGGSGQSPSDFAMIVFITSLVPP